MGGGSYDYSNRSVRAQSLGYTTKSATEIFSRDLDLAMSPNGVEIRESRDSDEHPNSFPIILALDETGSMGSVPHYLVKEGLPNLMKRIIDSGIDDPQILFLGIGDHKTDYAPLQVGQFESSDELLDHWLTKVYLEGNGGGNGGESYSLAHYFAGYHTSTDSWEKRKKKGVLITIGDERNHKDYNKSKIAKIMGQTESGYGDYTSAELIDKARETWEIYHVHTNSRSTQSGVDIAGEWKEILGEDNVIVENNKLEIPFTLSNIILNEYNKNKETNKEVAFTVEESIEKPQNKKVIL